MPDSVSIERRQMLEVFGAEVILTPGAEGPNGAVRRALALADEHPEWCFLYQYANDANPRRTTRAPVPRSGVTARDHPLRRRARHERHADGRGSLPQGAEPGVQVLAVEPPIGELVEGLRNLDEGYVPPVFDRGTASICSTASASCGPRDRWSGHAAWCASAACSPASRRARRWPARSRWRARSTGRHRLHRVRRRLEVPVDRRLHRRPRRGRSRREDHLLLVDHVRRE